MGKIEDGMERLRRAEHEPGFNWNRRSELIDIAMDEAGEFLNQSEYKGDVDSALIHHFREEAFFPAVHEPYLYFCEAVARTGRDKPSVPILFHFYRDTEANNYSRDGVTALVSVSPGNLQFRSVLTTDEPVHDEEKKLVRTMEHRVLSLVTKNFEAQYYLSDNEPVQGSRGFELPSLPLSRYLTVTEDSLFQDQSSGAQLNIDRLGESTTYFIGWEEIETYLLKGLDVHKQTGVTKHVKKIYNFFEAAGILEEAKRNTSGLKQALNEYKDILDRQKRIEYDDRFDN